MDIHTDGKKHLSESFKQRSERDKRAKELRLQGWLVNCKKWNFTDLGGEVVYSLEATY